MKLNEIMLAQILRIIVLVLCLTLASKISADEKTRVAGPTVSQQTLKSIEAVRDSSFFSMRGSWRHPISLRYPSTYKVVPNSHNDIYETKNFYLIGNRATMITERQSSIVAINPKTKKPMKFEARDVWRDIWLKINGKWYLKNAKPLSDYAFSPQIDKRTMHVYIVPGYGASTSDHWFPWLKKELEKKGAIVYIIDFPSPNDPSPDDWQKALDEQVSTLDRSTYFISHSLGTVALLRYLETASIGDGIGGYILVSGFNDSLSVLPQLDSFKRPDIDYERLIKITNNRVVIAALDDVIVPHTFTENLAASLDATFIPVQHGGHFLGSDGFTKFPLVLSEFEKLSKELNKDR